MSNIRRHPGDVALRNFSIDFFDTLFLCDRVPKQTASSCAAISAISLVNGIKSQATFSLISYSGFPWGSSSTFTIPVSNFSLMAIPETFTP